MAARPYFSRLWSALTGRPFEGDMVVTATGIAGRWEDEAGRYDVLDSYRSSVDLYGRLQADLQVRGYEGYQNLRNPANRLAELYAAKLTDALLEHLNTKPDEDDEQPAIADATPDEVLGALNPEVLKGLITQVWEWSNWEDKSEVAARNFCTHGDLFIKVENSEDNERVQFNLLDPRHVGEDFQTDTRGFFTYLRLDIPQEERDENEQDEVREFIRTEVWDKQSGQYLVYEHEEDQWADLADLGTPKFSALLTSERPTTNTAYTGYDFIPVVHRKLKDTGDDRGEGAFQHALDGIDTSNWMATRLNKMLFPKVTWKATRQAGPGGLGLGPIELEREGEADQALSRLTAAEQESYKVVEAAGAEVVRLPTGVDFSPMVPQIDFASHLAALADHLKELEKDLPELAYYRLREMDEISGRAAMILLGDVLDRLGRARRKFEDAHVRAHKMALTIGRVMNVPGFEVIPEGAYEEGLLDHSFDQYQLFPTSKVEKAEADGLEATALAGWKGLGPEVYRKKLEEADLGLTDDQLNAAAQPAEPSPASLTGRRRVADILGTTATPPGQVGGEGE